MGRKRKEVDQWMPERVYRGKSAYEYRPKKGICIRLCSLDAKPGQVWRRYEEEKAELASGDKFGEIVDKYFLSKKFDSLANRTQTDYRRYWVKLKPVFGKMNPRSINRKHIKKYHFKRTEDSPKQANVEKAFMSAVFTWAMQDILYDLPHNPCHGVKPNKLNPRDVYITDWEYDFVYQNANTLIRGIMEVSYLCAARLSDVIALKREQLLEDGVYIEQAKTGTKQIKKWGPKLRKAIDDVLAERAGKKVVKVSPYVFVHSKGTCYTSQGFGGVWRKLIDSLREELVNKNGGKKEDYLQFTFHDLKSRSISDFTGTLAEKQTASGHKTMSQLHSYNVKTPLVDTVETSNERKKTRKS